MRFCTPVLGRRENGNFLGPDPRQSRRGGVAEPRHPPPVPEKAPRATFAGRSIELIHNLFALLHDVFPRRSTTDDLCGVGGRQGRRTSSLLAKRWDFTGDRVAEPKASRVGGENRRRERGKGGVRPSGNCADCRRLHRSCGARRDYARHDQAVRVAGHSSRNARID